MDSLKSVGSRWTPRKKLPDCCLKRTSKGYHLGFKYVFPPAGMCVGGSCDLGIWLGVCLVLEIVTWHICSTVLWS